MSAPNPDDPLSENVAKHWKDNEPEAIATGGWARPVQCSVDPALFRCLCSLDVSARLKPAG
jgi:hypothetical protein